jgi:hypothetical protein
VPFPRVSTGHVFMNNIPIDTYVYDFRKMA